MSKLSEKVRPNVEAAPWVIYEIANLEDQLTEAQAEIERLFRNFVQSQKKLSRMREVAELARQFNDGVRARVSLKEPHYTASSILKDMLEKALADGKDDGGRDGV